MHGLCVYKNTWNPCIGEDCLKCRHEKGNEHDEPAMSVCRNHEISVKYTLYEHEKCLYWIQEKRPYELHKKEMVKMRYCIFFVLFR